jgi:hypothetical protein
MPFQPHEIERRRRSVAMVPPNAPSGLSRAKPLEVLTELADVTNERDRLRDELIANGPAQADARRDPLRRQPAGRFGNADRKRVWIGSVGLQPLRT